MLYLYLVTLPVYAMGYSSPIYRNYTIFSINVCLLFPAMSTPPLQHCSVFYSSGDTVIYRHTYVNSFPKKTTRYEIRYEMLF